MDYSIYDALEAGFNKVVFVIRKDLEKDFKEVIGESLLKRLLMWIMHIRNWIIFRSSLKISWRAGTKPWGTGQAILCCKEVVHEPFLVINADDYYGKEAYVKAYEELIKKHESTDISMVGFVLKNTLSKNGTVTRGVCKIDEHHMLREIEETYGIESHGEYAVAEKGGC